MGQTMHYVPNTHNREMWEGFMAREEGRRRGVLIDAEQCLPGFLRF